MSETDKQFRAEGDVDKLVRDTFFPGEESKGVFVDVGAARPDYLSVSASFRASGWRVIAVDPNFDTRCRPARSRNIHSYHVEAS